MKTLYVVNCWVPFPESEYGGMHVVIASSDEEAHTLLMCGDERHGARCVDSIAKASRVAVSGDEVSRVVRSFTT